MPTVHVRATCVRADIRPSQAHVGIPPNVGSSVQDFDAPRLKAALAAADRSRLPEYRRAANDLAVAYWASVIATEISQR
jgi:hypothetical protein